MITDTGKYYLYRHIRLDTGTPFYIGIGTKSKRDKFCRAKTKVNRNGHWLNITAKTEYIVEILLESDSYEFIKQKEIEFIALYGRVEYDKYGILCNKTIGGEGTKGIKHSDEVKLKWSLLRKERGFPEAFIKARELYRVGRKFPKDVIDKRQNTRKKKAEERGYYVHPDSHKHEQIKVDQYTKEGVFVKTWDGIRIAAKELNVPHSNISALCKKKGRIRTVGGYKWEYHNNKNQIT